jgi:methylated-DNA-[protein]-cysteine S-methyltransferase
MVDILPSPGETILARGPKISLTVHCQNTQISRIQLSLASRFSFQMVGGTKKLQEALAEWLEGYAEGKAPSFSLPLPVQGFTRQVLDYLPRIPFGETTSYAEVARALGNPKAARAVGNACRVNPFPLLIPCHRVISSSGLLGGFSPELLGTSFKNPQERVAAQLELKHRLLSFEGVI